MAIILRTIIPRKLLETAITTQYTAVNCKAVIDKFTVTNTSLNNVVFDCYLVLLAATAGAANRVIATKQIAPLETYTFPELVGQSLEAGGFIATSCGTASTLVISASGREITN